MEYHKSYQKYESSPSLGVFVSNILPAIPHNPAEMVGESCNMNNPQQLAASNLPFMPKTRRGAAAEAEKSNSKDNSPPPPEPVARPSNKNVKGTTTTAPKSKTISTSKKSSKAEGTPNQANQSADSQSQPSAPIDPPIEPSETAHSGDEVDESAVGVSHRAKSPVHQRPSTPQSTPQAPSGHVPQTSPPVPAEIDAVNPPANHADKEGGENLRTIEGDNTRVGSQDDGTDPEGQGHEAGFRDSPSEEQVIESSPSRSDYSDTWRKLIQRRQRRAQQGHITTDTERDDDDDDRELADQVDAEPGLPNAPHTTEASSSNEKGKQKASLKPGRLSAEDKEDIRAFSEQVLGMAQDLADRLRTSRKNVLISAGFGIKESRSENIANLHAQWYAATHTKPVRMSREDYARCISADYHKLVDGKSADEKDSNLKEVREWAASRERVADEELSLKSVSTRATSIREKFTALSQSVENLYDISVIGALIYVGSDVAGQQLSSLFTGSPVYRRLIDENDVNVREILNRLTVAVKAPGVVSEGFNIPTFNTEAPHELEQRQGEAAKDRDRRAAGIIFRDSLGLFLPGYSQKMHLPWKRWLELAAKEYLCIIDWEDAIMPPGPGFDIKKLGSGELRDIAGSYVDSTLNGSDDYEAFSVVRWSEEHRALPNTHRQKGLIPLVVTRSGTTVRQLRDSHTWKKLVAKELKKAARVKPGQDVESEDDDDDDLEEEEQYNGNQSDNRNEVQSNATSTRGRSSKEHATRSRPQPKSRSDAINLNRQQSVRPGTSDDEAIRPRPPPHPTACINASRQHSIHRSGTPVDLRAHETSYVVPNNRKRGDIPSTTHRHPPSQSSTHDSRSRSVPSGNSTQRGSHSHPSSRAGMHYEPPSKSARPRLQPPANLSPPRPATKRHNPGWSDDDSAQFDTAPHYRRANTQGQFIPRSEADSWHSRHPQATVVQQSSYRHLQRSDPPRASTNKRLRASTSQGHSHSILHHDHTSAPSTSQQRHATGYRQPPFHQLLRSPGRYRQVRASSTIEEEDTQMGEQPMFVGDPDDRGGQHTGYHREDAYDGRDPGPQGGYFNDGDGGEEQNLYGDDEYEEYPFEERGTFHRH